MQGLLYLAVKIKLSICATAIQPVVELCSPHVAMHGNLLKRVIHTEFC